MAPKDIEALLDELEAKDWLSDRRFAESYVADKRGRFGRGRLAQELRRRGVAADIVDEVLAACGANEVVRLREVWARKFGAAPKDARAYAKQTRFLLARGFAAELVARLLKGGLDED